jgi:hypothetical protein
VGVVDYFNQGPTVQLTILVVILAPEVDAENE